MTFRSQWETTANVAECVSSACLAVVHGWSEQKVAERLLHHPDQIFRLNYVLGSYSKSSGRSDDWGYEGESNPDTSGFDEASVSVERQQEMQSVLESFLQRIRSLAQTLKRRPKRIWIYSLAVCLRVIGISLKSTSRTLLKICRRSTNWSTIFSKKFFSDSKIFLPVSLVNDRGVGPRPGVASATREAGRSLSGGFAGFAATTPSSSVNW